MFNNLSERFCENKAAIDENANSISYAELHYISTQLKDKIRNRSLIFCLCTNTIGCLYGYFSFIKNGVVPLMLDASLDLEFLSNLQDIYQPEYFWAPNYILHVFSNDQILFSISDYSLIKVEREKTFLLHNKLAILLATSGSTGSPKLVRLSYENIEVNAESIAEYLSINESERPISTLPMHYSFGLSIINSHLIQGATLLLTTRSLMEKKFWVFLKEQKGSSFSGVPYTFEILKKLRFFKMNLPHLKTLTQAGGKLNHNLNKEFSQYCKKNEKQFYVMYGQTEATARMSYLPPDYTLSKLGSMGVAIPGGEFRLIDEEGSYIDDVEIMGELVYRGRNVSMGYAESGSDLQKGDENKGVLFTGDLAKRDGDNFYYIVGRKKRFIKLYGNRINLDETEQILKNIVQDCACIGEDDNMIVFITEINRTHEVREYISNLTKINQSAFSVQYISEIPKNPSGKTIYSKLIS